MGKGRMKESSPNVMPWRQDVKFAAIDQKPVDWNTSSPMALSVVFRFQRPASHFNKNGLSSTAPLHCISARNGDLDKLVRSTNDALTGVLFDDDKLVIHINATKRFCVQGEQPGAVITLTELNVLP